MGSILLTTNLTLPSITKSINTKYKLITVFFPSNQSPAKKESTYPNSLGCLTIPTDMKLIFSSG